MILTPDQQQVKALLTETITLLCKNGLHFQSEFSIEGLIGITLDQKDVFLINIKETIKCDSGFVSVKCNSRTKADQLKRASPTSLRSKKFGRTNESNCAETLNKLSHGLTNISSVSLNESAPDVTDSSDVKMEFSSPDQTEYSQPVFEDSQLCVPVPLTVCHNSANRTSISSVSDGNIFSENVDVHDSLEPLSRRLCRTTAMAISESSVCNDTASDLQENPTFDSKVCKSEPLDVVEIPDDEVESSANSENSYLMYLSMYGNGREGGNHPDVGYSIQYDELQINQHSLPGCSSWDSASRVNNFSSQDKVELIEGSSVYVSSALYQELEHEVNPKASRLVRRLVHEIFPDERTLASSSCLGKRQSCSRGLDQTKIDAIKDYVHLRCPDMTKIEFVRVINIMCCDARKTLRNRLGRMLPLQPSA